MLHESHSLDENSISVETTAMPPDQHDQDGNDTAPLLGSKTGQPIEEATGAASEEAQRQQAEGYGTLTSNEQGPSADTDALERQDSLQAREAQIEGMAEVRKRFAYIFPAVAIGVYLGAADQCVFIYDPFGYWDTLLTCL